ncbi:MAG: hypothetical protein HY735_15225 [Verrucomicrobia bacterium]|nr:hypothetical protein [Verrucomicrobiota bacterium]
MLGPDNSKLPKSTQSQDAKPEDAAQERTGPEGVPHREPAWEEEIRLNEILRRLPDAPLSSNFTARVLREVERELQASARRPGLAKWGRFAEVLRWSGWGPKLVALAAIASVASISIYQHRIAVREEMARSVAAFSNVAAGQSMELLLNFEAIKRLPDMPKNHEVDVELLAALR